MKYKLACLGLMLIAAMTSDVSAVLMKQFDIAELTAKSDVVVHGTVLSQICQRDKDGRIYTSVTLVIEDVMKGNIDTNSFRIIHSGGVLGDEVQTCSAQVEFEIGEEIVAMLVLNERGEGVILGLVQGKFNVWKDKDTGEKFTHNIFQGKPGKEDAGDHGNAGQGAGGDVKRKNLSLKDLKREIRGGAK